MESNTEEERAVPDEIVRDSVIKDIALALVVLELVKDSPDVPDELRRFAQIAVKRLLAAGHLLKTLQS